MIGSQNSLHVFSKWLRIISPCVIAIAFCILAIILSLAELEKTGGWSFLGVIFFFPALVILFVLDLVVKAIFKSNTLYIWLIELLIVAIGVFIFFGFIG